MAVNRPVLMLLTSVLVGVGSPALAQPEREMRVRLWNLTAQTITNVFLAPAGSESYGPDQCRNERGHVAPDERLRITGINPGRYDAKLQDQTGRVCVVRGIAIKSGTIIRIAERDLTDCQ
jgi:hypothetical protein